MRTSYWNFSGLLAPVAVCAIGLILWWRYGFAPLDRAELPVAAFINGMTGRSQSLDSAVIFLNHRPGEILFVLIIFTAYALFTRWIVGRGIDWRPACVFAVYIFVFWFVANAIGDHVIERFLPRDSPSHHLVDHPVGFVDLEEVRQVDVKTESRSSFPSNHGTVFFTVFSFCLLRFGMKAWVLWPLVVLLSMPRCFTGAHWMSDSLIGSWAVTWLVAAIAMRTPLFRLCLWAEQVALRIPPRAPVGRWPDKPPKRTR
jgi:membrane-associated phospholipid phosphatase